MSCKVQDNVLPETRQFLALTSSVVLESRPTPHQPVTHQTRTNQRSFAKKPTNVQCVIKNVRGESNTPFNHFKVVFVSSSKPHISYMSYKACFKLYVQYLIFMLSTQYCK